METAPIYIRSLNIHFVSTFNVSFFWRIHARSLRPMLSKIGPMYPFLTDTMDASCTYVLGLLQNTYIPPRFWWSPLFHSSPKQYSAYPFLTDTLPLYLLFPLWLNLTPGRGLNRAALLGAGRVLSWGLCGGGGWKVRLDWLWLAISLISNALMLSHAFNFPQ